MDSIYWKRLAYQGLVLCIPGQVAVCPHGYSQDSAPVVTTLRQAVFLADRHNPSLQAAEKQHEKTVKKLQQARGLTNPEFEMEAENFGATGSFRGEEGTEFTAKIKKRFRSWGGYKNNIALAGMDTSLTFYAWQDHQLDTWQKARLAYLEVWLAREHLELTERNLELSREAHEQARRRVLAGDVSPMDSVRTGMRMIEAGLDSQTARAERELAAGQMEEMWGGVERAKMGKAVPLPEPGAVSPWENWSAHLAQSPAWKSAEMEARKLEKRIALEKATRAPGFEISGGLKTHENAEGHAWTGGVSFPLPLLNWNRPGIAAARREWEAGKSQTQSIHTRLKQRLRETHTRALLSEKRYEATRNKLLPAAREFHDASLEGYKAGKYSGQLLLDARREWLRAELDFLNVTRHYHQAVIHLERIAGIPWENDFLQKENENE